jgi:MFS-type transporter involved in bile tolerance (Atg22 family)
MQEMYSSSMERTIKRLWITIILLIVLLVGTNVAWIIYEAQFTDTEVTQEVDTGNGRATVSGTGDIYGEGKADSQN